MPWITGSRKSLWRWVVAGLISIQAGALEFAVFSGTRFSDLHAFRYLLAVVIALVYLAAGVSFLATGRRHRRVRASAIVVAIALTLRSYSPLIFSAAFPPYVPREGMAGDIAPSLVEFLRELASAEEQYRLNRHSYSFDVSSLRPWVAKPPDTQLEILVRGDTGWSARISDRKATCTIWVRDSAMRASPWGVEGSPRCSVFELREAQQRLRTNLVPYQRDQGFAAGDVTGVWLQHRADPSRSGTAVEGSAGGHSWTTRIGGALRSSVAIAGNQVFVGAHGNGEVAALSLDSGKIGWRIRAPNWIHHEPVITRDLVIFGFGNNELSALGPAVVGSPPSGVVAYDRLTGREKWRRYTTGSVMTSPVEGSSLVAVVTGAGEVTAWRATDGALAWRTSLPDYVPMGNPLLVDSLLLTGVEPTTLCALSILTGKRVYCTVLGPQGWGAGHASAVKAGNLVLQVYEEDMDGSAGRADPRWISIARRIFGIPPRRQRPRPPGAVREQVMVGLRLRDGAVVWRVRLGRGTTHVPGHIAGTPTVRGGIAYVPSTVSESIVAVDAATGHIIWSARVRPARGSVTVTADRVISATTDGNLVVLNAVTGELICHQRLPDVADRAGLTVSDSTGILTLTGGIIMARNMAKWMSCAA